MNLAVQHSVLLVVALFSRVHRQVEEGLRLLVLLLILHLNTEGEHQNIRTSENQNRYLIILFLNKSVSDVCAVFSVCSLCVVFSVCSVQYVFIVLFSVCSLQCVFSVSSVLSACGVQRAFSVFSL